MIMLVDTEDPDQIVQMHRLIWAFTVHLFIKTGFRMVQPILCWCLLEAPQPNISKEYPEHMLCVEIRKIFIQLLLLSTAMDFVLNI